MDVFFIKIFILLLSVIAVWAEGESNSENDQVLPRYVVFPGLDAEPDEVAEWSTGFASPFNVYFGPKPYVLGWVGEAPFAPIDEDEEGIEGEIEGEEELEEGEEGELEEGEIDEEEPDYDYEKA